MDRINAESKLSLVCFTREQQKNKVEEANQDYLAGGTKTQDQS
jgi:hypothetical protein